LSGGLNREKRSKRTGAALSKKGGKKNHQKKGRIIENKKSEVGKSRTEVDHK